MRSKSVPNPLYEASVSHKSVLSEINKMLKYDYILIYWLVVVKGTNIFQELVHADVKNMSVKAVGNKNVTVCNILHVLLIASGSGLQALQHNKYILLVLSLRNNCHIHT